MKEDCRKLSIYSSSLRTKTTLFFVFVMLLIIDCFPLHAAPPPENPLDLLIKQALEKKLHTSRVWHLLLHYQKKPLGGFEGREDGPDFYNSPMGKTNPQAELKATLTNFFKPHDQLKKGEEHPQCNFAARYKWLKKELSLDTKIFPDQACPRLNKWLKKLNPKSITLVFSSFYMNNPASMFGHTLLRIDSQDNDHSRKLLNYGVNYAAEADTDNPLLYIVKGLFGLFKGNFSIFPYHIKVQRYNNMESRDLWEYELNFTEDQIDTFLRHLWELGGNYFDYYYFQENCSYHILSLLEVANPELYLTDQFWFHVIPSDTVKAVMRNEEFISNKIYRPSILNKMAHKRSQMTKMQEDLLQELIRDPSSLHSNAFQKLNVSEKALVFDTFLDYAQYINMRRKKIDDLDLITNRAILLERSKLGLVQQDHKQTEFSTRPELGHGSDRLKIGVGAFDGESFEEIAYRPAYHDLLAKDIGFGKGSQILFLDVTARYYHDIDQFKLDKLQLIDIISLTPYDPLFKKKSWQFNIGIDTIKDFDCNFCNAFKTAYGFGLTYKPTYFSPFTLYSLLDIELELSNNLESDYRAGGGGTIGFFHDLTDDWRIQALANYLDFPLGHDSNYYTLEINQRYALSQNLDLRLELNRIEDKETWLFSLNAYF